MELPLTGLTKSKSSADYSNNVPLYFLIEFPTDYPQTAPSVGFCYNFPYLSLIHILTLPTILLV